MTSWDLSSVLSLNERLGRGPGETKWFILYSVLATSCQGENARTTGLCCTDSEWKTKGWVAGATSFFRDILYDSIGQWSVMVATVSEKLSQVLNIISWYSFCKEPKM